MSDYGCEIAIKNKDQRHTLVTLFVINGVMFLAEGAIGIMADSTALIADSLDMFADAAVYAIGLYAVGRSLLMKARAAQLSGIFQVVLGLGVLIDILRRAVLGSEPEPSFMILLGLIALTANTGCLLLIQKLRHGEIHMRASWIFSKNDVIANTGVVISGVLVSYLHSPWPDLIIGLMIAVIVVRGGIHIIKDANAEMKSMDAGTDSGF